MENTSVNSENDKFYQWTKLKIHLDKIGRMPRIKEGEIWWAAVGKNIGVEINGKSKDFSRPILIYKKLGRQGFLAIPLTTQSHIGSWNVEFEFKNKTSRAVLSQIKVMSVSRLYKYLGRISESDFKLIKIAFKRLYLG